MMKTLTKAEEQVMQVMWKVKEGFIRDIMDALPVPKPHQNTVATILKILIEKESVSALSDEERSELRRLARRPAVGGKAGN